MTIGKREFDTDNKCYIMGILNVTPDSFSDGGSWNSIDAALFHAESMKADGADIIDVGGESTRPGYKPVSAPEEIERILPVVAAMKSRIDIPVSVDTYKSAVAEAALDAGAVLVNDIWGLRRDPDMAALIARSGAACCLMHNREDTDYRDFMRDLISDLYLSAAIAEKAGIEHDKIILDPGVGFAKTHGMDLEVIRKLDFIINMGFPVMLGASRKSFIGAALGLPVDERVEGSLAAAVIAVTRGCSFIRTHDVKETKLAVKMAEAILDRGERREERGER